MWHEILRDLVFVNFANFPKIPKNNFREKETAKIHPLLKRTLSLQLQHKKLRGPKGNLIPNCTVQRDPVLPVQKKQLHWISAKIVY